MTPAPQFEKLLTTLLRDLVTEIVAHPADLEIRARSFHTITDVTWRGHRADTPGMIGEGAQTYHWLKMLVRQIGERHGYEADLARVGEPVTGTAERYPEFASKPKWPQARLLALLQRTVEAATREHRCELETDDSGDQTAIVVNIATSETLKTETVLREILKHIFKAIFNANGRLMKLTVIRTLEPEQAQPATAAGRFAKETK
jgi:predicted RNA-binding protein YlqC (UPF0109 family)